MLSRAAERAYWAGRYLERAENTARIVQQYSQLLLDLPDEVEVGWHELVQIFGGSAQFSGRVNADEELTILQFLLFDPGSSNSLNYTIRAARDNIRNLRDLLPQESWECVNELHQGSNFFMHARMKLVNLFLLSLICMLAACLSGPEAKQGDATGDNPWTQVDSILARIQPPSFPAADFDVTEYGAVSGGETDCHEAFAKAIATCSESGGGRVVVPEGTFLVNGPIHLESNINLHISEGATVKFGTDPQDYPLVFTRWEGMELMNYSPLIYAYEKENIAITGSGTLDGQASNEHWWPWAGSARYGWKEGTPRQQDSLNRPDLGRQTTEEVPVRERIFGEGHYLRPNFIQPYRCKNVLIQDVTVTNSPMWLIHPVLCENVTVQGIRAISHGPNSDGCDPESCKDVLIKDCYFDTGDDCIALKSGRNQDGRNIGAPIENVVVQDCEMKDGHGGVVIGSETSGGARNIFAENCVMDSPNLERAIRVKTNKARGGTIENLYFRNIEVGEVSESVVKINMLYTHDGEPGLYIPTIRNIHVENVTSQKSEYAVQIIGYDEKHPVRDIYIQNCSFTGVEKGNSLSHAKNLHFRDLAVNGELVEAEE